ncbi:PepSY domain-containing protein [Echinicola sediminis]
MKKNLYNWIWKWHFIGGLISLPVILILAITGTIYLFKEDYEQPIKEKLLSVSALGEPLSYQRQWEIAKENWDRKPNAMELPASQTEATAFVSGMFSHKSSLFVDPYSGKVNGTFQLDQSDMHQVRKLHGELLMGGFGTKIVELTASWMVVLILTGLFVFWPRGRGWRGFFTIRTKGNKRIFYRDLHAVTGFWFSILLLLILAGGLPWTDVFGSGYQWVQKQTDTGFPAAWQGRSINSEVKGQPLSLDDMVNEAEKLQLKGQVSIGLPKDEKGVYTISNQTSDVDKMVVYHFDQYSGELLYHGTWDDIGVLMKSRLWVMAFHQGEFGWWNWMLVLLTALALVVMSLSAIISYVKRKKKGEWGIPDIPQNFSLGKGIAVLVIVLGLLLPLFGMNLILIYLFEKTKVIFYTKNTVQITD